MQNLLVIAIGGATGAVLRFLVSDISHRLLGYAFPWGTLIVNLSGCLLIGVFWEVFDRTSLSPASSAFLFMGVLGAFTTFSTYGLESIDLMRDGKILLALLNILVSNLVGLALVALGYSGAGALFRYLDSGGTL